MTIESPPPAESGGRTSGPESAIRRYRAYLLLVAFALIIGVAAAGYRWRSDGIPQGGGCLSFIGPSRDGMVPVHCVKWRPLDGRELGYAGAVALGSYVVLAVGILAVRSRPRRN